MSHDPATQIKGLNKIHNFPPTLHISLRSVNHIRKFKKQKLARITKIVRENKSAVLFQIYISTTINYETVSTLQIGHERKVALFSSCGVKRVSNKNKCGRGLIVSWMVVVCYWLISCEWQVIAPPSSSEKRCSKRKLNLIQG